MSRRTPRTPGSARVELAVDEAEPVLRAMLAGDPTLGGLEVAGIGLDDAFLSLTADRPEAA